MYERCGMAEGISEVKCGMVEWVKRNALKYEHVRRMTEERIKVK